MVIEKNALEKISKLKDTVRQLERMNQQQADTIRELTLREYQYYSILDNMSEPVEKEFADYRISYVNNAYLSFFEVEEEEVLGKDSFDVIHEEDKDAIFALMDSLSLQNPSYRYECRTLKKDGTFAWIEVTGCAFFGEEGNIVEYQEVVRDITRYVKVQDELEEQVQKRTQELVSANHQLQEINRYWEGILQNMSESVIVIDTNGDVEFLNRLPMESGKISKQQLRKKLQNELNKEDILPLKPLLFQKESFTNLEVVFPLSSGSGRFLATGFPLQRLEGQPQKAALILQPISNVHRLVNRLSGAQAQVHFSDIITNSLTMQNVIRMARFAAASESTVLIEGESGTGKELFAQSIHNDSPRAMGPFVAVNCGAIPRELVASELFGYSDGAFTGAKKGGKPGKFELAAGGTIFLDEIGDMPMEQQVALLRVIQERKCSRVGSNKEIPVDVRLVCATNKDLLQEVAVGNFRKDLYYRLNVINLQIPPLRERNEDILLLLYTFLNKSAGEKRYNTVSIDPSIVKILLQYHWPGNVRELQNIVERMVFLGGNAPFTLELLPNHLFMKEKKANTAEPQLSMATQITLAEYRKLTKENDAKDEAQRIMVLLEENGGNVAKTARALGISRTELYRKMNRYQTPSK